MKILMVHPHDLFSKEEPWTTRIRNIALEFKRKKHLVKVIYFPLAYCRNARPFYQDDIEFIPLSRQVGIKPFLKNIVFFKEKCKWPDVIHFQKCFYHAAIPALIGAFLNKKPAHYDWDDWEIKIFHHSARQPWLVGIFLSLLERHIPYFCDTISVSSLRLKEECLSYGIDEENIVMAPVGADINSFTPKISAVRIRERYIIKFPVITYMGQLHSGQYVGQFIRAAKLVLNQMPNVTFMIIGGGYKLAELKKLSAELNINENVIFTGALAHQEIPLFLAAADICVACFEDNDITRCKSPLKIAEYLASGKAIVASDVGEVKRMLGGAGIITEAANPESLAYGIIKLIKDDPLRERLSLKARQRAEELYNWRNTADNLLKAYRSTKRK